jgi:hypothetical protein
VCNATKAFGDALSQSVAKNRFRDFGRAAYGFGAEPAAISWVGISNSALRHKVPIFAICAIQIDVWRWGGCRVAICERSPGVFPAMSLAT